MSTPTVAGSSWARLGTVSPDSLRDARQQLHHAAQIAVSAAISYLPARSDDSHTALSWAEASRALVTEAVSAAAPFRVGVRVADLTLVALDDAGGVAETFSLAGRTTDAGYAWLAGVAASRGLDGSRLTTRKHYTIPDHPVAADAEFSIDSRGALPELDRYWSNAAEILDELARATPGASEVRTWPHHFDIATLITLSTGASATRSTIGVGQSPGDESYDEPYWYVGPYPYPDARELPSLRGNGHWHTTGWFGAALPASDYIAAPDQRAEVSAFIESAVAACRALLGA